MTRNKNVVSNIEDSVETIKTVILNVWVGRLINILIDFSYFLKTLEL